MATSTRPNPEPARDGRLRRSERSRQSIVAALVELVGEGILQPTAEQVADRAGVGIRTVFRHFSDMEGLYAAMDARLREEFRPLVLVAPLEAELGERARGLVRQRVAVFERLAPYEHSSNIRRWRSAFLQSRHIALVRDLRADLLLWLPELRDAPEDLVEALDLVTSFEAWDRLRGDQRLSRARAQASLTRTVLALLGERID